MSEPIPAWIVELVQAGQRPAALDVDALWCGQPRRCPRCEREFVSVRSRGLCHPCHHMFCAYELYGPPLGIDLTQGLRTVEAYCQRFRGLGAVSLNPVAGFPIPPANEHLSKLFRMIWNEGRAALQLALERGGSLYQCHWTERDIAVAELPEAIDHLVFGPDTIAYLVVQDGWVCATMQWPD